MSTLYAILPCVWPASSSIRNADFNMDVIPFHIARYLTPVVRELSWTHHMIILGHSEITKGVAA
jgi:hypothetical protein